ncbi:MAG TPA: MauE/DoxX family redox-associated membrane protein [Gaiellaceae bacterium]
MHYLSLTMSLAVVGTLFVAALAKLATPDRLGALLGGGLRLNPVPAALAARAVGATELAVGVALVTPPAARIGGYGAAALGCGFFAAAVGSFLAGSDVPCGCFGASSSRPLGLPHALLGGAVSLCGVFVATVRPATVPAPTRLALVAVALVGAALVVHSREITAARGRIRDAQAA